MSRLLSQTDLDRVYKSDEKKQNKHKISSSHQESTALGNLPLKHSIFLCHSHLDKTIVKRVLALFQQLEVDLYIDWMDISLPDIVDRQTATLIQQKIRQSKKFLFLATYNALRSRWCNWELGLAFSTKEEGDFAILPIESRSGNWSGNEYLQLYPEMQIDFLDSPELLTQQDISINYYTNRKIKFDQWLEA
jgi:hypothetical protein